MQQIILCSQCRLEEQGIKDLVPGMGIEESEMKAPVQMGLHMICTAMETEGAARSCLSPAA